MSGPLAGVKVVDFSSVISGPLATMLLADQGAEVIKVEAPGRPDLLRKEWHSRGGLTSLYANVNRGKRGVSVDLGDPRGLEIAYDLTRSADVVVENYRPGVAERLGIGPDDLHAISDRLIYCRINGYGPTGPRAMQRAYDPVIQGATGYVAIQCNPEIPISDLVRNAVVDKVASYTAAQAITAALLARERGAAGQTIEVPMIDAGLAFLWPDGMMKHTLLGDGVREGPALYERYQLTETSDGQVVIWTGPDAEWHALFRAIDRSELCVDERFATARGRVDHAVELSEILRRECRSRTTEQLLVRMREEGVPGGPVVPLDALAEDSQIVHNGVLFEREHPTAGTIRQCLPAQRFSGTPTEPGAIAPLEGEHTAEVLTELGYDDARIIELEEAQVIVGRS